jgi:hypothetical protein
VSTVFQVIQFALFLILLAGSVRLAYLVHDLPERRSGR